MPFVATLPLIDILHHLILLLPLLVTFFGSKHQYGAMLLLESTVPL